MRDTLLEVWNLDIAQVLPICEGRQEEMGAPENSCVSWDTVEEPCWQRQQLFLLSFFFLAVPVIKLKCARDLPSRSVGSFRLALFFFQKKKKTVGSQRFACSPLLRVICPCPQRCGPSCVDSVRRTTK